MKTIDIVGSNYSGTWKNSRTACRAVIERDAQLLMSWESKTDTWMLPGGGLEGNEGETACCVREVAEETGFLIRPSECLLEIDEFYGDFKWISRYFRGEITGTTDRKPTPQEIENGLEPRWVGIKEILSVLSQHESWAETDEMRRGMYLREYKALTRILAAGFEEENPS